MRSALSSVLFHSRSLHSVCQRCFHSGPAVSRQAQSTEMSPISERALGKGSPFPPLRPGTLRLYNMRFCPYAQRTRLLLEHRGIPYETVNVNLKYKPDWFIKRNPLGLVPVLEHDGKVVYESLICNDYLEEAFVESQSSRDPYERACDKMLAERQSKMIKKLHRFLLKDPAEEDNEQVLKEELDVFERELACRGDFFSGSEVGNLDFLLWPWFERLPVLEIYRGFKVTDDRFPRLVGWMKAMYCLPAVQKLALDAESHLAFLVSLKNRNPDYDYGLPESKLLTAKL